MSGCPYKGTAPARPSYGGSNIHAPSYSTSTTNGSRDASRQHELVVPDSSLDLINLREHISASRRYPNVNDPNFASPNASLNENTTGASNHSSSHQPNNTIQLAHAPSMFQDASLSYFGGGTFNNAGGSIITDRGNGGEPRSMNGVLSGNRNSGTEAGHESNNAIQPVHAPSMFQDTSLSYFGGGTFNNAGGSIITGHGNGGEPRAMSRGRSGHENNNIGEAGHESSNTFQPTLAPSMFQGSSRNHFEGGLFNNAGGNIRTNYK